MTHATQAIRSLRGDLGRAAAVLCIAAGLTLALGMVFPVQHELDTVGYHATSARSAAPLSVQPDEVDEIRAALDGAPTAIYMDYLSAVEANGTFLGDISLWVLLGDSPDTDATFMPDSTRIAGGPRDPDDHRDWIDINVDIAQALGVGPGDRIKAYVDGDEPVQFIVRGVYASRHEGDGHAHIPAAALARLDPAIDLTSMAMFTGADADHVERLLNSSPWKERLKEVGYPVPLTAETVDEQLERVEKHTFANLALVLVASAIALVALLALIVAEVSALVRSFRERGDVFTELGARPVSLYRGVILGVSGVTAVAVAAGSALGSLAYATGFAGPVLPPTLAPAWLLVTLGAIVTGCITAIAAATVQRATVAR